MRNANSPNFPFKISHSYSSNNYCPHTNRKKPNELRTHLLNSFTNENMDMFRLDCNKELNRGGYHNKYYDNIIKNYYLCTSIAVNIYCFYLNMQT